MATRLWSIQRQCLSPTPDDRLYKFASRTSPHPQFRRGIYFISQKARHRLRPEIRIGMTVVPTGLYLLASFPALKRRAIINRSSGTELPQRSIIEHFAGLNSNFEFRRQDTFNRYSQFAQSRAFSRTHNLG